MNIYTFHRKDGWYPIELTNDVEAAHHVVFNPGTLKVVNEKTGNVVYEIGKGTDVPLLTQPHNIP